MLPGLVSAPCKCDLIYRGKMQLVIEELHDQIVIEPILMALMLFLEDTFKFPSYHDLRIEIHFHECIKDDFSHFWTVIFCMKGNKAFLHRRNVLQVFVL